MATLLDPRKTTTISQLNNLSEYRGLDPKKGPYLLAPNSSYYIDRDYYKARDQDTGINWPLVADKAYPFTDSTSLMLTQLAYGQKVGPGSLALGLIPPVTMALSTPDKRIYKVMEEANDTSSEYAAWGAVGGVGAGITALALSSNPVGWATGLTALATYGLAGAGFGSNYGNVLGLIKGASKVEGPIFGDPDQSGMLPEIRLFFPPESSDASQSSRDFTSIYAQDVLDLEGVRNLSKFYDYPTTPLLNFSLGYAGTEAAQPAVQDELLPPRSFDSRYRYQAPIDEPSPPTIIITSTDMSGFPVPDYHEPPAAYQYPNDNIDGWDIANFSHPDIDAGAAATAENYAAIQSDWDAINQNYEANRPLTWKEGINTAGSAINTAYNVMSFGSTLQDVLTGRRSDPGAYLSLANSTAQGLNWLAKTDGVKDIVSAIGDLQGPLDKLGNVTGGAMSGWGLYQNIAGLANGEVNAQNVLGVAANAGQLYQTPAKPLPTRALALAA